MVAEKSQRSRTSASANAAVDSAGSAGRADNYRVEALAKGLRILGLFAEHRGPLRLTALTELTDLPMPTVYRLTHTLVEDGYLERLPDGQLRTGPAVLALAFSALQGLDLAQVAAAPLHKLARLTGQTVNLGVLRAERVVYLERLRNSDLVTANLQVGSTAPAYCTSMGKLLLALTPGALGVEFDERHMGVGHGPKAARSRLELERMLAKVRKDGWAVQDQEFAPGLRSVAGPVRNAAGQVVAAVNVVVQAPNWSVKAMLAEYLAPLLTTCDEISRLLGNTASPGH